MTYPRYIKDALIQAFKVSPVTLLIGPRQSGKTTIMRQIGDELGMNYLTFDTLKQLTAAREDPEGFVAGLERPVIIDEVQRVPEIALPIKLSVDESRVPGSFGLTGSANPLVAPRLNDSLAGRMFILHMWPLSMSEIRGTKSQFLQDIFDLSVPFKKGEALGKKEMVEVFSAGGYPNALELDTVARSQWYDNLLTTILERDVNDIASIARPSGLVKLLNILAMRSSNLLNMAELSRISGIANTTLNHYMILLESLFLIVRQPAWHLNRAKRLIKMPKIYFGDTGLLINQLQMSGELILENPRLLGPILENFVFLELKKLSTWSPQRIALYHYRIQTGNEVDFIVENRDGRIVGIEVKASESITKDDWKGMEVLSEEMGDKLVRGIILYPGKEVVPFGKNRFAVPLSALWK